MSMDEPIGYLGNIEVYSTLKVAERSTNRIVFEGGIVATPPGVQLEGNPPKDTLIEYWLDGKNIFSYTGNSKVTMVAGRQIISRTVRSSGDVTVTDGSDRPGVIRNWRD